MRASTSESHLASRLRAVSFVAICLFMFLAPAYRHLLGGSVRTLPAWRMFRGIGFGVVDARFFVQEQENRRPVDPFVALGARRPRRLEGWRSVHTIAQDLCTQLGERADVRVVARIATPRGWRSGYTGERNICELPPPLDLTGTMPVFFHPVTGDKFK